MLSPASGRSLAAVWRKQADHERLLGPQPEKNSRNKHWDCHNYNGKDGSLSHPGGSPPASSAFR